VGSVEIVEGASGVGGLRGRHQEGIIPAVHVGADGDSQSDRAGPSPRTKSSDAAMVAAAYDLTGSPEAWFGTTLSLFRAHMDQGFGAFGGIVRRDTAEILHFRLDGAHPIYQTLVELSTSVRTLKRLPQGFSAATSSEVVGLVGHMQIVNPVLTALGMRDCNGLWGPDAAGLTIGLNAPRRDVGAARRIEQRLARKVLPHFAAALRLRRSLTGLSLDAASAEALFDPDGRCVNAQGMAEPLSAREALRCAVARMHAKGGRPSGENVDAREALLEGRWSLVDRFDSDGRRFVVAYRNPEGVLDPRRLSQRERDVAVRIAQGATQTDVAAELGIRASTVATIASSIVGKLGLRSARELPLFWRDAGGDPVALGRGDLIGLCSTGLAPVVELTPAERDVLESVILGRSNREIAAQRGSSIRTVANQVASLLKKHGVVSRGGLSARKRENE
jgi:DNA-binding NarL/FixJ family response regulator